MLLNQAEILAVVGYRVVRVCQKSRQAHQYQQRRPLHPNS